MKIIGIEHLAIATEDVKKAAPFWNLILGIPHRGSEEVTSQKVLTDIYDTGKGKVELLGALAEDSPISRFLEKRGSGIHHVCFEVESITEAIKELKENNIQTIGDDFSIGAEGYKVIFIHPKATGGVLVELTERPA